MTTTIEDLAVDLDGVLVDFDKAATDLGFPRALTSSDKKKRSEFWATVGRMHAKGIPFWGTMPPMADAMVLWDYLMEVLSDPDTTVKRVYILSATGHVGGADAEKRVWVPTHLGRSDIHVELVKKSVDKAKFATPNTLLIDDRSKAVDPFLEAGGLAILHTSAAKTIEELDKLLYPVLV